MYIPYTTFRHSFTIVEALVIAGHKFLYPFIVEWCRLRCKPRDNGFFDLVVVEPPATKESLQMQENMTITWRFFPSTTRTKTSLTTDGRPFRLSSYIFARLSLKGLTHLRTIESCFPYTSQSWLWISAGFMFLAFKKRITDRITHAAGF
jgi:hypothetical protein